MDCFVDSLLSGRRLARTADREPAARIGPASRARRARAAFLAGACALGLLPGLGGCERGQSPRAAPRPAPVVAPGPAVRVEDLDRIRWHRQLRVVLAPPPPRTPLAAGTPAGVEHQIELLRQFAERYWLEPLIFVAERWEDLLPALDDGRAHLAAAPITVSEPRKGRYGFTVPVHTAQLRLVARAGERLESVGALAGREIAVREHSAFWDVVQAARSAHPTIGVRVIPESMPLVEVLDGVARGELDLAAVDTSVLEAAGWSDPRLRLSGLLRAQDARAFAAHPAARQLVQALNVFLSREKLAGQPGALYKDDLPGLATRGVLRVLTRNNATSYFIWRGELVGFEYELLRRFAEAQELRLEMVVAPSHQHLWPMLLAGAGDVLATALSDEDTPARIGATLTRAYLNAAQVLVGRASEAPFTSASSLEGRTVVVRRSSRHWRVLESLLLAGAANFTLKAAPEDVETEELIAAVAAGHFDLTAADSHELEAELAWRDDVRALLELAPERPRSFGVRADNPDLLAALDAFLEREYRGLHYNITFERYFRSPRHAARHRVERVDGASGNGLSPFDALVREHAAAHGFDWTLIVAQIYQESRFDPRARSFAGARGLMQMLPATAKRFGVSDPHDPDQGVRAGVRYLAWLHEQFEDEVPVRDRMWFALAAYNAGLGHVYDARRLAEHLGYDTRRWFGQVEDAMRLLSRKRYYRESRHGYVRGEETARYVRAVRDRWVAYTQMLGQRRTP